MREKLKKIEPLRDTNTVKNNLDNFRIFLMPK